MMNSFLTCLFPGFCDGLKPFPIFRTLCKRPLEELIDV